MAPADLGLGLVMLGVASTMVAYFGPRPAAIIFLVLAIRYDVRIGFSFQHEEAGFTGK
jgi:hypothetical protein